ncbi:hypothetical protein KIW84_020332 [Lathyrus oleraceus]|uniref:Uncharacterized protein n=1 Tax=Pisum sativum TaxID=3888 RepID=A0A9D4Y531_PEA|nr:hypothetical protein KIW84_020332 [Pisum sativum]
MITSWNVRGLNKLGKNREISSCLYSLKPNIAVLIENRVNQPKADKNGKNLSVNRSYIDNYSKHNNGRIWTPWEASRVQGMMENTGLFGIDSKGDKLMLSNKQTEGIIYTKIDRAIANVDSL